MNRVIKFIRCFSLVIILSLAITYIFNPMNKKISINTLHGGNIQVRDLNKALSKCYYYKEESVQFTSVGLTYPNPQVYPMHWILEILKSENILSNSSENIINSLEYLNLENETMPELMKLSQVTSIYKKLGYIKYDRDQCIKMLLKHYDATNKLFFNLDPNEELSQKILATDFALTTFNNINYNSIEKKMTRNKLIDIYNNDAYFSNEDLQYNIELSGSIIKTLMKYGDTYEKFKKEIKDRSDLIEEWNENIFNSIELKNPLSIFTIKSLIEINKFVGTKLIIPIEYEEVLSKNYNTFEKTCGCSLFDNLDPQFLSYFLDIYRDQKWEYPYKLELTKYLGDMIEAQFCKNGTVKFNIEDNYYGIAIANVSGYKYNREKMKKILKNLYIKTIEDNSSISNSQQLKDMYYLLLSLNELNINYKSDKKIIERSVFNYLISVKNDTQILQDEILDNYYIGLKILNLIGKKKITNSNLKATIKLFLDKFDSYSSNQLPLDKYYYLAIYMRDQGKAQKIYSMIANNLNKYSIEDAKNSKVNYSLSDEEYMYNILKIKSSLERITDKEKEIFKKYIIEGVEVDDLLGIKTTFSATTLKGIYYNMLIDKVLYK